MSKLPQSPIASMTPAHEEQPARAIPLDTGVSQTAQIPTLAVVETKPNLPAKPMGVEEAPAVVNASFSQPVEVQLATAVPTSQDKAPQTLVPTNRGKPLPNTGDK